MMKSKADGGVGRFDFQKLSMIFPPGVSIILFYFQKGLEELSAPKIKNCLDTKGVTLYSKIAKIHDFI